MNATQKTIAKLRRNITALAYNIQLKEKLERQWESGDEEYLQDLRLAKNAAGQYVGVTRAHFYKLTKAVEAVHTGRLLIDDQIAALEAAGVDVDWAVTMAAPEDSMSAWIKRGDVVSLWFESNVTHLVKSVKGEDVVETHCGKTDQSAFLSPGHPTCETCLRRSARPRTG